MKFDVYIPQGYDVFCEAEEDPTAQGIWLTVEGDQLTTQVKALAESKQRHLREKGLFSGYTDIVLRVFEVDLDGMDRTASDPA